QLLEVHEAMERCHRTKGRNARSTFITGDTGLGKTEAVASYVSRYSSEVHPEWTRHRVVSISLKARTTTKEIILKLFRALGVRRRAGTEGELFEDLLELLRACQVELIVIDEIQHVLPEHSHRRLQENRDFFKSLLDQSGVPMVFVGLPKSLGLLEAPRQNPEKRSKKRLTFLT